ncbi:tRNA uridine-5-carboxymethylaminomethyl(34) synthesis GTPase MnmE [Thermodesulfobacteriota bacterium]
MIIDKREFLLDDTIASISTPLGEGGISIIRMSGKDSMKIAASIFRAGKSTKRGRKKRSFASHKLYYGHIIDNKTGDSVDEVLLAYMKSPKSYTKEDVVEISCHGGMLPSRRILDVVLNEGARLSAPGEFTKRAFLNGRIDLTQAESVIDVIRSKTEKSMLFASQQLNGEFSKEIITLKDELVKIFTYFQAYIDFPEDDTDIEYDSFIPIVDAIMKKVDIFLETYDEGMILRNGIKTAIVGKPNVGKSSLLNVLLKEERAIVTEVPGTTRDTIEEVVNIKGIPLRLIDTAGIRESKCVVESVGINLTKEKIKDADFVFFVVDAHNDVDESDDEIYKLIKKKKILIIVNKIDLVNDLDKLKKSVAARYKGCSIAYISAKKKRAVTELRSLIYEAVMHKKIVEENDRFLINSRHKDILKRTMEYLKQIQSGLSERIFPELICVPLNDALDSLGEVLGETTSDDILNNIFSEFCIGK